MTTKQQNLVYSRARDVFSQEELDRINAFVEAIATEDSFGREKPPKLAAHFTDRRDFIDAVVVAEKYQHAVKVLNKEEMTSALHKEKSNVLNILEKYGF